MANEISQILKLATVYDGAGVKQLHKDLDDTESKGSKVGSALAGIGKGLALAGGVAAAGLATGLVASVKTAADFEESLHAVAASAGVTGDELEQLRKSALQTGKDTALSAKESLEAYGELVKAGVDVKDVIGGAGRAVVDFAVSQGAAVGDMATLVSNSLNTFQDSLKTAGSVADQSKLIADVLAKTANASAIDVHQIAFSLSAVGPVAAQAGLDITDFSTAIGLMGNNALVGQDAGTSLKTMLLSLTAPSSTAAAALDYLGVSAFDSEGKTRKFRDILGDLQKTTKDMSDQEKAGLFRQIFGTDGIRAANILVGEGTEGWDKFQQTLANAPGVSQQAAERMKGLKGALEQFHGSLETLEITIGTKFLPILTTLATKATEAVNALLDFDPGVILQKINQFAPGLIGALSALPGQVTATVGTVWDWLFQGQNETGTGPGNELSNGAALLENQILPVFQQIRDQVMAQVGAVTDWLFGDRVGDSGVVLGSRFDAIASFVTDKLLPPLLQLGDVLLNKVGPALESLFTTGFQQRMQVIGDLVEHLIVPALGQLADFFVTSVLPAAIRFTDWLGTTAIPAVQAFQTELVTTILPALTKLADLVVNVVLPPLLQLGDWILNTAIPVLAQLAGKVLDEILPTFDKWLHQITDELLPKWIEFYTVAIGKIQDLISWVSEHWDEIYRIIKPVLDTILIELTNTWDNIKTVVETAIKVVGDILSLATDIIKGNWSGAWDDVKRIVTDIWDGIKGLADNTWKEIRDLITGPIGEVVSALGDKTQGLLGSIWGGITGVFHDIWQWLTDRTEDLKGALLAPFKWFGDHVGDAVSGGINAVLGLLHGFLGKIDSFTQGIVDAINWVTSNLNLGNVLNPNPFKYASLIPEHLAKGTANWAGGYAWVGEGPGGVGAELAYLAQGSSVLPHAQSMALVRQGLVAGPTEGAAGSGVHVPGFLFGLDPDDILGAFKGAASAVVGFAHEWIAKGASALLDHALDQFGVANILPKDGVLGQIAGGLFSKLKDELVDGIKQLLDFGGKALPQTFAISVNLPGAVTDWLAAAAQLALGRDLSAAEMNAMLWLVGQESGGNPNAVNPEPVGNEHATGLLQTLPSTFAANMVSGHGNILDPIDNAAAAMRYIMATYHGDLTAPARNEQAGAAGYANGGRITERIVGIGLSTGRRYTFGEAGDEVVIPLDGSGSGLDYLDTTKAGSDLSAAADELRSAASALRQAAGAGIGGTSGLEGSPVTAFPGTPAQGFSAAGGFDVLNVNRPPGAQGPDMTPEVAAALAAALDKLKGDPGLAQAFSNWFDFLWQKTGAAPSPGLQAAMAESFHKLRGNPAVLDAFADLVAGITIDTKTAPDQAWIAAGTHWMEMLSNPFRGGSTRLAELFSTTLAQETFRTGEVPAQAYQQVLGHMLNVAGNTLHGGSVGLAQQLVDDLSRYMVRNGGELDSAAAQLIDQLLAAAQQNGGAGMANLGAVLDQALALSLEYNGSIPADVMKALLDQLSGGAGWNPKYAGITQGGAGNYQGRIGSGLQDSRPTPDWYNALGGNEKAYIDHLRSIGLTWTAIENTYPGSGVRFGGSFLAYASGGVLTEPVSGIGLLSGRGYRFGEAGPERIIPLTGPDAQAAGDQSGGVVYHINATVTVPASNLHEVQDVLDLFGSIPQVARARGA